MAVFQKIKEARKLLKLTQKQFSEAVGVPQKDISLLESGKKSFIPNDYILFLYKNNIDVNTLYGDEEVKLNQKIAPNTAPNSEKSSLETLIAQAIIDKIEPQVTKTLMSKLEPYLKTIDMLEGLVGDNILKDLVQESKKAKS